ncbi:MAG: ATP-binding cassette domain-containing protein, partial [Collinsella stercoris]|nr:ATP-binding cassette domain-containing protein [Collinsella stercoris]
MTNTEAPERTGALIQLTHVHLAYPGSQTEALSDVSLSIPTGQHVCILGGNGSGKSTLLQLVNVLALPTSGAVHVAGIDTREPGRALEIRSRTASVFQHPEDQMVTSIVADDVAFGPENLRVAQPKIASRVDAALAAVGMKDRAQSDPSDLSGGQVQRVAIAGALAMEPDILLLDEPCAMLDVEGRESVRTIIRNLCARGMTILHVTHFMEDAQEADRAIVLKRGRVAFDGTPSALFSQPDLVNELGLEMPGGRSETGAQGNDVATDVAAPGIAIPDASVDPSLVFEHVSFSYERAANPRKRTRRRALFGS